MALQRELERIATAASALAPAGTGLRAVLPAEPAPGLRRYVCAFSADADADADADPDTGSELAGAATAWLVLDAGGEPVIDRREVKDAVALAALCEIAADSAAAGDLDDLHSRLVAVRLAEAPAAIDPAAIVRAAVVPGGIDEVEEALRSLQRTLGYPPQLASPGRLDAIGEAARRLERLLDPLAPSPFAAALAAAAGAIEALVEEVEAAYLGRLV